MVGEALRRPPCATFLRIKSERALSISHKGENACWLKAPAASDQLVGSTSIVTMSRPWYFWWRMEVA